MISTSLQRKYDHLKSAIHELGSVVIGYSGGVDSTLLLRVAVEVLGDRAIAVIGRSETYPKGEYEQARQLAGSFGARVIEVQTEETDDLKFRENPPDRCYYCKTELFSKLHDIAAANQIQWVADGTNVDDLGDFRPGLRARRENHVCSPLLESGLTKQEVRDLSRFLKLPTWNKQSFACLSSRFPYGQTIKKDALMKIEDAETLLRDLGFNYYRARHHDERTLRIEIGTGEIPRLLDADLRNTLVKKLKELGFTYITLDLEGYRTGSMNEVLDSETKRYFIQV